LKLISDLEQLDLAETEQDSIRGNILTKLALNFYYVSSQHT